VDAPAAAAAPPRFEPVAFGFRPWVRASCRKALAWGAAVLAALALCVWALGGSSGWAWDRALGSLLGYSLFFWASLAKIWWTAGRPAVTVAEEALFLQALWAFRPRRVPYARVLAAAPRPGTASLALLVERRGVARELYLNLAVVEAGGDLLARLGERLEAAGLAAAPGARSAWARPTSDRRSR
jgi:hypothetical protein